MTSVIVQVKLSKYLLLLNKEDTIRKGLILSFILVATFVTVQAQRNEVVAAAGD